MITTPEPIVILMLINDQISLIVHGDAAVFVVEVVIIVVLVDTLDVVSGVESNPVVLDEDTR